jgi:hypothetical protein
VTPGTPVGIAVGLMTSAVSADAVGLGKASGVDEATTSVFAPGTVVQVGAGVKAATATATGTAVTSAGVGVKG